MSKRSATTVAATGDLIPRGAEERAVFIRAVTAGLNDLEAGREISFDDAAIRLGLNLDEAPP
ncbi:MAG: hypothetical protein GWN09_00030 [Gammaproteobacteria bacterium]|nr:hypothetical protein [Gammaproteobacteria bacterium]